MCPTDPIAHATKNMYYFIPMDGKYHLTALRPHPLQIVLRESRKPLYASDSSPDTIEVESKYGSRIVKIDPFSG